MTRDVEYGQAGDAPLVACSSIGTGTHEGHDEATDYG